MSALRFHPRLNMPRRRRPMVWLALFVIDVALAAMGHDWGELRRNSRRAL
jgi:hypothetical protein